VGEIVGMRWEGWDSRDGMRGVIGWEGRMGGDRKGGMGWNGMG